MRMTTTDTLLGILIVAVIGSVIFNAIRNRGSAADTSSIHLLQNQINQLTNAQNEKLDRTLKELNDRLNEQNKTINEQMSKSNVSLERQFAISQKALQEASASTTKIIKEVTEKMTKLDDTNKQIVGFAEQMQSLEGILKNPKKRGILGEYYLESVLKYVLPPDAYKLQSRFANGEIVDALILTREGSIPVDSKFSLENYNQMATASDPAERDRSEKLFKQDLMKRIEETAKYIRPNEGTLDFAFMFIPADGLYYELLSQKIGGTGIDINQTGLIEYAFKKRVIITTPTTFFAYLQTVLQGLRSLKIEESTKQIKKHVENLQRHLAAYGDYHAKLGKHLGATTSAFNLATKEFSKVDKDIIKITGAEEGIELELEEVEKPILGIDADI